MSSPRHGVSLSRLLLPDVDTSPGDGEHRGADANVSGAGPFVHDAVVAAAGAGVDTALAPHQVSICGVDQPLSCIRSPMWRLPLAARRAAPWNSTRMASDRRRCCHRPRTTWAARP